MTKTASWAVDEAPQVAVIAAQVGTEAGLGGVPGLGEASGERVGDALGVGVGVGLPARLGDGLGRAAEVPGLHPASASSAANANTPSLTGS